MWDRRISLVSDKGAIMEDKWDFGRIKTEGIGQYGDFSKNSTNWNCRNDDIDYLWSLEVKWTEKDEHKLWIDECCRTQIKEPW